MNGGCIYRNMQGWPWKGLKKDKFSQWVKKQMTQLVLPTLEGSWLLLRIYTDSCTGISGLVSSSTPWKEKDWKTECKEMWGEGKEKCGWIFWNGYKVRNPGYTYNTYPKVPTMKEALQNQADKMIWPADINQSLPVAFFLLPSKERMIILMDEFGRSIRLSLKIYVIFLLNIRQ